MPLYTQVGHRFMGMPYSFFYIFAIVAPIAGVAIIKFFPSAQAESFKRDSGIALADSRPPSSLERHVAERKGLPPSPSTYVQLHTDAK